MRQVDNREQQDNQNRTEHHTVKAERLHPTEHREKNKQWMDAHFILQQQRAQETVDDSD